MVSIFQRVIAGVLLALLLTGGAGADGRLAVTGEGSVFVVPDMAQIRLGVVEESGRAQSAIAGAARKAGAMLAALEEQGIAPRDVQTGALRLQPVYAQREQSQQAPVIAGYRAEYIISLVLKDLDAAGAVLDRVMANGANRLDGLTLGVSEPKIHQDEAERRAVADAIERAERLADAAGVKLGKVLILRQENVSPRPVPMARMEAFAASEMAIAPGQGEISATVVMEFAVSE